MSEIDHCGAFRLGDWHIEPSLNRLSRDGKDIEIEPKSMAVLAYLARRPGQVISSDNLIDVIWQGRPMGDNPVHRCISRLRQALGDDAKNPRYIATIQRKGYRLVAAVEPVGTRASTAPAGTTPLSSRVPALVGWGAAGVMLLAALIWTVSDRQSEKPAPTVAVMPFKSLSADPWFADGVSEDIRSGLADVEGLSIASRSASSQFPPGTDPPLIADRLNVSWVLEGTARRDSDEVRVTAQLINARSRFVHWSDSYEGTAAEIFDIQKQIATQVARSVVSTLPSEWRLLTRGTDVVSAYDDYLRGQAALNRPRDDQSLSEAETHFKDALEYDPDYARAHAGLCRAYVARYIHADAAHWVDRAEQACDAARALDPTLSEIPTALGLLYRHRGEWQRSLDEFDQAIALNTNAIDALTGRARTLSDKGDKEAAEAAYREVLATHPNEWTPYTRFGAFLFHSGRYADAARMYQRVVELRPGHVSSLNNLGAALYLMGDLEMAAKAYEESLRINPNRSAHSNLGTLKYYLGDYDEAVRQYRSAIELKPHDHAMWGNLGDALSRKGDEADEAAKAYIEAVRLAEEQIAINPKAGKTLASIASYLMHLGRAKESRARLGEAMTHAPGHPYVRYYASVVYTLLGDYDNALSELEEAVALGYPLTLVTPDPEFIPLRGRPAYESLFNPDSDEDLV